MDLQAALEKLCGANGPSGFETEAVNAARALLAPLVDETWIDKGGNLIGLRRCGRENAKKILLDAHLDEIGLIVTGIDKGFLRVHAIGGVDERILMDQTVTVMTDPPITGVVSCLPPHIQAAKDYDKAPEIEQIRIDIGLSEAQAKENVPLGTPLVVNGPLFSMGNGLLCSKALDDRAGFLALLRAMERLQGQDLPADVYVMGSAQEEVGGRGAQTGAFAISPDCCIAVDVTFGKTPDTTEENSFPLGSGAALGVGPNMTRWMSEKMQSLAKAQGIPHQIEVMAGSSGTNAWYMQVVREGIATMVVSLPVKHMHTPIEVLQLEDVEAVSRLLEAFVLNYTGEEGTA